MNQDEDTARIQFSKAMSLIEAFKCDEGGSSELLQKPFVQMSGDFGKMVEVVAAAGYFSNVPEDKNIIEKVGKILDGQVYDGSSELVELALRRVGKLSRTLDKFAANMSNAFIESKVDVASDVKAITDTIQRDVATKALTDKEVLDAAKTIQSIQIAADKKFNVELESLEFVSFVKFVSLKLKDDAIACAISLLGDDAVGIIKKVFGQELKPIGGTGCLSAETSNFENALILSIQLSKLLDSIGQQVEEIATRTDSSAMNVIGDTMRQFNDFSTLAIGVLNRIQNHDGAEGNWLFGEVGRQIGRLY